MKIRTFIICESFSYDENTNEFKFKNMMLAIKTKNGFPHKDSLLVVLIFDDVEDKPKKLDLVLLNPKDKAVMTWNYTLSNKQNSIAIKLEPEFIESGTYHFKISYDHANDGFLGRYPLYVYEDKGVQGNET